jgi:hypothetical protein
VNQALTKQWLGLMTPSPRDERPWSGRLRGATASYSARQWSIRSMIVSQRDAERRIGDSLFVAAVVGSRATQVVGVFASGAYVERVRR